MNRPTPTLTDLALASITAWEILALASLEWHAAVWREMVGKGA